MVHSRGERWGLVVVGRGVEQLYLGEGTYCRHHSGHLQVGHCRDQILVVSAHVLVATVVLSVGSQDSVDNQGKRLAGEH